MMNAITEMIKIKRINFENKVIDGDVLSLSINRTCSIKIEHNKRDILATLNIKIAPNKEESDASLWIEFESLGRFSADENIEKEQVKTVGNAIYLKMYTHAQTMMQAMTSLAGMRALIIPDIPPGEEPTIIEE